jgi:hypothetical protein
MRLRSSIAAAALAAVPAVLVAAPADDGTRWIMRSSGVSVQTQWIEWGALPGGVPGNVHVGNLFAEGDASAFAYGEVIDWTCPDGARPPAGGGHGGEPEPTDCTLEAARQIFSDSPLTLTTDKRLTTARLTGTLIVTDHDGTGTVARPPVDITWMANTAPVSSTTYAPTGARREADLSGETHEDRSRVAAVTPAVTVRFAG